MNSRIRYIKTKTENILESKQVFISETTGARYKVFLDVANKTFRIRNELSKENIIMGGDTISNLNVLKRVAKRGLERLGVKFEDESRYRTFGLCEKGYNQDKHNKKQFPSHNETE